MIIEIILIVILIIICIRILRQEYESQDQLGKDCSNTVPYSYPLNDYLSLALENHYELVSWRRAMVCAFLLSIIIPLIITFKLPSLYFFVCSVIILFFMLYFIEYYTMMFIFKPCSLGML